PSAANHQPPNHLTTSPPGRGDQPVIPRPLRWLSSRLRSPRVLAALLLLAVGLAVAAPHLRALYPWHAARRALARQRPRQADPHLQRCLRAWPNSPAVHLLAARAARLADDHEAAERHLAECQRLERKSSDASVLEWSLLRAESG